MLSREQRVRKVGRGTSRVPQDGGGDGDEEGREEGEEVARADVLGLGEERGGPEEQHGSGDSQFSDDEGGDEAARHDHFGDGRHGPPHGIGPEHGSVAVPTDSFHLSVLAQGAKVARFAKLSRLFRFAGRASLLHHRILRLAGSWAGTRSRLSPMRGLGQV